MDLQDRVVLITGASMGIGEALARAYVRSGARVVLNARSGELLEKLVASLPQGRALAAPGDVTDRRVITEAVDTAIQRFGKIDIVVNNAGVGCVSTVADLDPAVLQKVFALNVYAPVYLTQAVLPHMKYRREGQIVNIASVLAFLSLPGMGCYCATKFALRAFTETMRAELKPFGIHVMGVYPGRIKTPFLKNAYRSDQPVPRLGGNRGGISAERCARAIVCGSQRDRRDVIVPVSMRALIETFHMFPKTVDRIMARMAKTAKTGETAAAQPQ